MQTFKILMPYFKRYKKDVLSQSSFMEWLTLQD